MEEIKKYMGSVNLSPINIEISEFGDIFDPSKLDYANPEKESTREAVLKVLKKVADLSSQSLQQNTGGLLAKITHNNDSLLWQILCYGKL